MGRRLAMAVVVAMGLLFISGVSAAAHTMLIASDPAANTTLGAPPASVTLTFNEDLDASFAAVTVLGADQTNWVAAAPQIRQRQLHTTLMSSVPAGRYTVRYRVVSGDGHQVTGSFVFNLSARSAPQVPQAAAVADTSTLDTAEPAPARTSLLDYLEWFGFGAAALALLAVGAWLRELERREDPGES